MPAIVGKEATHLSLTLPHLPPYLQDEILESISLGAKAVTHSSSSLQKSSSTPRSISIELYNLPMMMVPMHMYELTYTLYTVRTLCTVAHASK